MHIYDTEERHAILCAMQSADGKNVYVSFSNGSLSTNTFIGKQAAREFAQSILEIVEGLEECDNGAQMPMVFSTQEAA